MNKVHGSPYDRGSADSYYQRGPCPHWYPEGTYKGECVTEERMTAAQIEEYYAGFDCNERMQNFKEWE